MAAPSITTDPDLAARAGSGGLLSDTHPMVAIIRCSAAEARHIAVDLETFDRLKLEWTWRVNRPQSDWRQGAHLTLIVADDHGTEVVSWLGWAG